MKKTFALLLVLAIVFPVVSLAVNVEEWLIEGSWNHFEHTDDGMLLTSMYLTEEGTAYYVTQLFNSDGPVYGRSFLGSWKKTGLNTIHVVIGNNSSLDLTYYTYNMMYDHELRNYYFRAELGDNDIIK